MTGTNDLRTDDFANVMRNGLGAIVAWFDSDDRAGDAELRSDDDPVETYHLDVFADLYSNGAVELDVYNEGGSVGCVELSPAEARRLFTK